MKKYRVIKSSFDGVSGGDSLFTLKEALSELYHCKGWDNLKQMQASIKRWAKVAKPGDVFKSAVSCIVCTGCLDGIPSVDQCPKCGNDSLDFSDLDPVEDGNIEQRVSCPECGAHWQDVFVLAERHELYDKAKAGA